MQDVLSRLTQEFEVVVPIVDGWGRVRSRLVKRRRKDGWYVVKLGSSVKVLRQASELEIDEALDGVTKISGLALGDELVPINFGNTLHLVGSQTVKFNFGDNVSSWEYIKVAFWEDGRVYYAGEDATKNRRTLDSVKQAFDNEESLEGISGVTPEMRFYYLCQSLYRSSYRAYQELLSMDITEEQRKAFLARFSNDFKVRLRHQIENAGGKLISYTKEPGRRYLVTWETNGQVVKSVINDSFSIIDLGFCASGHDRDHTLQSAVHLSKVYQEEGGVGHGGLYITRR